eukprot:TRINITY_DN12674_c0_g1_i4.p1 TRINITY_DN12674_c0_g1~~TRINITY_DN12674_c0_g1_i4.p1  ORF type:complete len:309 (+),score=19.49 TRINITY_DN12674_c0_g1_i4:333-1259(+)
MAAYIKPKMRTSIMSPPACEPGDSIKILALVMSAPHNWRDRQVVRNTWAKQLSSNVTTKVVFIMGRYTTDTSIPHHIPPKDEEGKTISEHVMGSRLLEEHDKYKDIIMADFLDTYLNLTLKTSFGLKWIGKHCPQAEVILKIDANVFLHAENLLEYLENVAYQSAEILSQGSKRPVDYFMVGNRWDKAPSNRQKTSKYFLPIKFYKYKRLPPFLRGMAYIFSGSLLECLYDCILRTEYIPGEDVFLTGLCASRDLKLKLTHHNGFWRGPVTVGGNKTCQLNNAVAVHDFEADVMKKIYETLEDGVTCV